VGRGVPLDFPEQAAEVVGAFFTAEGGGIKGLRFGAKSFVAQFDRDNKVVIEFKDELASNSTPQPIPSGAR